MDAYELSGMLFGHKRAESDASERLRDLTISGVAESDSADGLVSISIDGDLTQAEDDGLEHDHTILIPTEVGVYAGDEVAVTLTGADLSTLRVTGVVGDGDRVNARISGIEADYVKATELEADVADIGFLKADSAVITDIQADTAKVHSLTAQELSAATGYVSDLVTGNVTAQQLVADHAKVGQLNVSQIEADHATIGTLDTTYMHADMANADVAWIQNGTIKDGAIVSAMINDVSANKLTAGTINGSVINVTNLNADNITTGTINGQRIGEGSLSLDKLSESVYTETEVDNIVDGLNDRIDGAIETHTGTAVPTLNNAPASSWNTTALRDEHVGDVYYVVNSQSQQNGYCYRFTKSGSTYSWQLIKDSDVTAALSRLTTAEGKITTFDSDISTLKTDTGELKTKTQSLETSLGDKVDTTTFNELSSTVDENSSSITSMSTVLSNNGLTSSTNITNTVNTVSQTATGNSSKISQLTTTLGTNADGTTKAGDVMHRTSAVEQDLSGFKTTVSQTYATNTTVDGIATRVSAAESSITQNAQNIELNASAIETVANPNISPFFSMAFDDSDYWSNITKAYITQLDDGWAHFEATNSGTSNLFLNYFVKLASAPEGLKASTRYTFLVELRDVTTTATLGGCYASHHYASQKHAFTAAAQFNLVNGNNDPWHIAATTVDDLTSASLFTRGYITVSAGASVSCDIRISLYEGEYGGPYKPYVGGQLYASKAELKVTNDSISTKVDKDGVISSINQSAESVKIQASKVEIDGTAVFTAISSDVDSAITSKGYATTTQVATAKSEAISAAATDATTKANAANSREQLVYRSAASGTSSMSGTTTWVTDVTGGQNKWTAKRPEYSQSYPVLFVATQRQTVGGTVTCTTPAIDATTTVIDGGNIITGSVTANKLNAADINASKSLTVGAMTDAAASTILNSNVSVGGRNLLRGSYSGDGWVNYTTLEDGVFTRRTTSTSETYILSGNATSGSTQYLMLDLNTTYTLSCWAKSNGFVKSMDMYCYDQSTKNIKTRTGIALTTDWVKYEFTFTTPTEWQSGSSPTGFLCRFDNNGSTTSGTAAILYVKWPMLERGNKATDWTPAPEDVDSAISDAAKTATSYVTEITGQNGIMVHPSTDQTTGVQITDSVNIMQDGVSVAEYGETARVGAEDSAHSVWESGEFVFNDGTYDTMKLSAPESITETHVMPSDDISYYEYIELEYPPASLISVEVDNTDYTYTPTMTPYGLKLWKDGGDGDAFDGETVVVTYKPSPAMYIYDGKGDDASNIAARINANKVSLAKDVFSFSAQYDSHSGSLSGGGIRIGDSDESLSEMVLTFSSDRSYLLFQTSASNRTAGFILDSGSTDEPERVLDLIYLDRINYVDPYDGSYRQLGKPTRLTASGSYEAGTSDTMGPAVTLTAGIWLIDGIWNFANSSLNAKRLTIGLYRSSTGNAFTYRVHTTASSNASHRIEVVDFIVVSAASETVTLYGASSPASTSAATQFITAVRLA